eukprot:CAMPEP_0169062516 /NCGR_PEP_ID=MMETSP1015-20121227/730_1 /TAXON_ID=342587 /ORGANISM="Karlodinium micrum, Strain CCMP2283" /LENGTH=174 /DNA_ID=CAMNT_0009120665 /DNA_START=71 /DNA_END=592 /DNA_ORIENTATION=-
MPHPCWNRGRLLVRGCGAVDRVRRDIPTRSISVSVASSTEIMRRHTSRERYIVSSQKYARLSAEGLAYGLMCESLEKPTRRHTFDSETTADCESVQSWESCSVAAEDYVQPEICGASQESTLQEIDLAFSLDGLNGFIHEAPVELFRRRRKQGNNSKYAARSATAQSKVTIATW